LPRHGFGQRESEFELPDYGDEFRRYGVFRLRDWKTTGASSSGKTQDFESCIRRFESSRPSQTCVLGDKGNHTHNASYGDNVSISYTYMYTY
jgi:hypothetical protein